jgi:Transglutaminase-like superfamily
VTELAPPKSFEYYVAQSRVTEPGRFTEQVQALPGTLSAMRHAASQLVFHYRGGGDWAANGVEAARLAEIDTRYAESMLARIFELSDLPLTADRAASQRVVGCCRDFTVLFLAIARAHGWAARARVGFGSYLGGPWNYDHVVAEVWDTAEGRWRLVDAQLPDDYVDSYLGVPVDVADLTRTQFVTGAAAWQACRTGGADAARFLVDPDLDIPITKGWPYIRHNLIHDLAALTKREMVLWDYWGWAEIEGELTPAQLAALDELAAAINHDAPVAELLAFAERDGLRVPGTVTSYSAACTTPLRVTV